MTLVPAVCTDCGHRFGTPFPFLGPNATRVTITGSTAECPRCHGRAQIFDASFNIDQGRIEMLSGPEWSWELVRSLNQALRTAVQNPLPNPLAPVAEASPELAEMIAASVAEGLNRSARKNTSKNRRRLTQGVLVALYTLMATDPGTVGRNLETIRTGVEWILQWVAQHGSVPPMG